MKNRNYTKIKLFALINLFCLCFLIFPSVNTAQRGGATSKEKLIELLRSRMYKAPDIAAVIKRIGVDFQLTPQIEQELVAAGARPEVIQAVRVSYRALRTAPRQTTANTSRQNNPPPKSNPKTAGNTNKISDDDGRGDDLSEYDEADNAFIKYQDLMRQAFLQIANKDAAGAVKFLQQGVQLAPKEPMA